jgi:hypothetical protein
MVRVFLNRDLRRGDLEGGQCLRALEGHTDEVCSVSVTPDGRRTVSGSEDKTLRVWDLGSGQCLGVFVMDAPVSAAAVFSDRLLAGTHAGEMLFLELRQLPLGPAILVAQQLQDLAASDSARYTARSSVCGQEFAPPLTVVAAIQNQSGTHISHSAILSHCPYCAHALSYSPLIVDLSDEAHEASLRRGLAHCRQTPDDDASTLGHLAALAVNLEKMGKSAEDARRRRKHPRPPRRPGCSPGEDGQIRRCEVLCRGTRPPRHQDSHTKASGASARTIIRY